MPKTKQTADGSYQGGKWVPGTSGRDLDPEGKVAVQKGMSKSLGDIAKELAAKKKKASSPTAGDAAEALAKRSGGY